MGGQAKEGGSSYVELGISFSPSLQDLVSWSGRLRGLTGCAGSGTLSGRGPSPSNESARRCHSGQNSLGCNRCHVEGAIGQRGVRATIPMGSAELGKLLTMQWQWCEFRRGPKVR